MKKKIQPSIRAHLKQTAFYLILLLALCAIPFALAQRNAIAIKSVAKQTNVIVVTNTDDSGSGSLRDALATANDGDTIDATGVSGTILLTSGELQINHNVTINGPGAGNLAVNGNATLRVFENFSSNVTISGLTITNGHPADNNGGGGILNHGGLTLTGTSIVGNSAFNLGGGIAAASGTVMVSNSTINLNHALSCGLFCSSDGGGIFMRGTTLTVTNSTINNNEGGGIYFDGGTLAVTNSSISGNFPGVLRSGGGIIASGTVTISNSTINGNQSSVCSGGGLSLYGDATVISSTISGNSMVNAAEDGVSGCVGLGGGGIVFGGPTTHEVINSTISGNHADRTGDAGGGIYMLDICPGSVTVINSTISDNSSAIGGGGGFAYECPDGGTAGTFVIENSTFSGNWGPIGGSILNDGGAAQIGDTVLNAGASGGTIFINTGTVTSLGYNLASDNGGGVLTGPGDQINTDPMLGPLQDNGGPTFTHALLPGSPAIDAGDPSFTPPPLYDQRGSPFHRVFDGRIDIGSFEVQPVRATPTPRPRPTPAPR
jgi:hypothetical protein